MKNLVKQLNTKPDFKKLYCMLDFLNETLELTPCADDKIWNERFNEIIQFQDEDGSFKLVDSFNIESDCRVAFCYVPTYICTAIIIKALLYCPETITPRIMDDVLPKAMKICCIRRLKGQGFDDISGQIEAIKVFIKADIQDFVIRYPNIYPEFTEMINFIIEDYRQCIAHNNFIFNFGENHEKDFKEIIKAVDDKTTIFVYGTLLKGQRNYNSFLQPTIPFAKGVLDGYIMYDIGSFPGIVKGNGKIKGELYRINSKQLKAIDSLEGEGDLYIKTRVSVMTDNKETVEAYAYVFNRGTKGLPIIPFENQPYGTSDYVWYVSYGSNMLQKRLYYYIFGGTCSYNNKYYYGCQNKKMPEKSIPVTIPYDMYYSNYGLGSWNNSAVSFLDVSKPGKAYGRAYLIHKNQLGDIHRQEGNTQRWYPNVIRLPDIDGIPAYTFAGKDDKPHEGFEKVSSPYAIVLFMGMKEAYPNMSDNEIYDYLTSCK